ncbi:hypothetical protein GUITHDRAFT_155932 [Guillardia theta CCMP2712]|uniref:Uncharacterized protein n=1 Tax=Guillardia theta (strain CCMP2712) TaxID=905079 RepID=L1IDA7_GUITC|nr:hypothetical protein GUITHDRAFT_155932 [Guillardia theta CCMP2712]EKX33790.1 hypothetical protein GUITHDRAFT_155932 [Guillardia theta CCMP2712]|eukprot:XP_005820770.1 hypothetical protein GUITHDRAFT_155932 [Guillardia theta CCMP2712]
MDKKEKAKPELTMPRSSSDWDTSVLSLMFHWITYENERNMQARKQRTDCIHSARHAFLHVIVANDP